MQGGGEEVNQNTKRKLNFLCVSKPETCGLSISLKLGNFKPTRIFHSIVLFLFLVTHEMKMKHYFSCRLETSGLPGRQ